MAEILPVILLAAPYSILCCARVPEVVLSTAGQIEEKERLYRRRLIYQLMLSAGRA